MTNTPSPDTDWLTPGAATLGLTLTAQQREQFTLFQALLLEWNARVNLTAITEPRAVQIKHFLDALTCVTVMPDAPVRVIDVGTGAGLPGIALKIVRPQWRVTLLEATGKKTAFLEAVCERLGLTDITVVNARAELAGHEPAHRAQYEWAVARAVAGLNVLVEYLVPFLALGGHLLAQKGASGPDEARAAESACATLGARITAVTPVRVPGLEESDARYLITAVKESATPERYPRRPGMPEKRPL